MLRSGIGLLNGSLLWGLAAVAVPLLLHLWRRRRPVVVDWGAMMFLDDAPGDPARRALRINDRLLLAVRMALLGLPALALARPYWTDAAEASAATGPPPSVAARGRTFVLAIDVSAGMNNLRDGITPRMLALRWARRFVAAMAADESAALIDVGARSRPRIEPPTRDKAALVRALDGLESAGGGPSDLAAALVESFRIITDAPNRPSDVILLTDGRRFPWRPDETLRWDLARELRRGLGANPPRIWALSFGDSSAEPDPASAAALGPLDVAQSPAQAGRPIVVSTVVSNPGTRSIMPVGQLIVDGRPVGPAVKVGPVVPGGRAPLSFTTTLTAPGVHLLSIALDEGDETEGTVEVVDQIPVLIVDGKPSGEPLGGQADFLRIALDPRVPGKRNVVSQFQAEVVPVDRFERNLLESAKDAPRVVVLADVTELNPENAIAVERYVSGGGGLLVVVGDEARSTFFTGRDWFPGRLVDPVSNVTTSLDLAGFSGSTMGRFSTSDPVGAPLSQVEVFRRRVLSPDKKAVVSAKLATGDPWCVERPFDKGRVLVVTTSLDGRATTLPINPDFVPLAHEWILSLARGPSVKRLQPGEPWIVSTDLPHNTMHLSIRIPRGKTRTVPVVNRVVRIDDTDAPGVYRLGLDRPSYAVVERDARESDPTPLSNDDRARLSEGWPLVFAPGDSALIDRIRSAPPEGTVVGPSRTEFWRILVLAALAVLCVESWLTRRMTRSDKNIPDRDVRKPASAATSVM